MSPRGALSFALAGAVAAASAGVDARDLWVDARAPDGGDGSQEAPHDDIGDAVRAAAPGDVVRVRRGTYPGGLWLEGGGDEDRPVTVRSEDGAGAAVIAGGVEGLQLGPGARWLVIEGFEIRDAEDNLVHLQDGAHHIVLRDLTVHHAGLDGDCIKLSGVHDVLLERIDAHHPGRRRAPGPNGWQEVVDAMRVRRFVVRDSYLHDGGNVLFIAKGGSRQVLLERSVIARQAPGAIDACVAVGGWSDREFLGDGAWEAEDVVVRNNVVGACTGGGVMVYDATRAWIVHNTLLSVGREAVAFNAGNAESARSRGVHVIGNLVADARGGLRRALVRYAHRVERVEVRHNAWWNGGARLAATGLWSPREEPGALFADPGLPRTDREVLTREAWIRAATPREGSPVLDRDSALPALLVTDDVWGRRRPAGSAGDRGAVERGAQERLPDPPRFVWASTPGEDAALRVALREEAWGIDGLRRRLDRVPMRVPVAGAGMALLAFVGVRRLWRRRAARAG